MIDSIEQKIQDLFELRLIPALIRWGKGSDSNEMLRRLMRLQHDIYLLDKTLEAGWEVNNKELQYYWNIIQEHLRTWGYHDRAIEKLLYRLQVYVASELAIRKHQYPSDQNIRSFYYFKSCDVKLMRDLIYAEYPILNLQFPKVSWVLFDLITEVNDDIMDESEDREVYNGNRFLISLYTHGLEATMLEYRAFLASIQSSFKRYSDKLPKIIAEKTKEEYTVVSKLLDRYRFLPEPPFIMQSNLLMA